ncbi:MAG: hypothetical protein AAFV53_41490 [Myxococcota bacterium]
MRIFLIALAGAAGMGCDVSDERAGLAAADDTVTWHQDVAPIVAEHCMGCHVAGGVTPFQLDSYEAVRPMAAVMLDAIESGRMPPWSPVETDSCDPMMSFENDPRLSVEKIETLRAWVEAGSPAGDPETPAAMPEPPALDLVDPDRALVFSEPVTVDGDRDQFLCFVLDPQIDEKVWVDGVQLVPDNQKVAHHALIYQDLTGATADGPQVFECFNPPPGAEFLMGGWVPGAVPFRTPEASGMPLLPESRLVVQMHYHPSPDGPEIDQSVVELSFREDVPEWEAALALLGNSGRQYSDGGGLQPGPNDPTDRAEFVIPAGATDHTETMYYEGVLPLPIELPVFAVGTHMHYVGVDMQIDYIPAEGDRECVIQTDWSFDWQRIYNFDVPVDELMRVQSGDSIEMRCTYDNSMNNEYVRRALEEQGLTEPIDVYLGEETLDEMCLGIFGLLVPPGIIETVF